MDLLAELAYVLSQNLPKDFDAILPLSSKMRWLFELIAKGEVSTDEEAARLIYESSPKDKRYLMLKRNLINKLVDLVPEAGISHHVHTFEEERFLCKQKLTISERLLQQNVYHNAERIIAKVLQRAEKHHLIDIQLFCAQQSRTMYALKGFPSETETYQQAVNTLMPLYNQELILQGYVEVVQSKTKYFLSYYPELELELEGYYEKATALAEEMQSPFFKLYKELLGITLYEVKGEHTLWQLSIQKLQELMRQYRFFKTDALQLSLHLSLAKYHRSTGGWAKAERYLQKCFDYSEYAAFNQFEVMAWLFDIKIKKGRYIEAGEIVKEVYETPQFELLNPIDIAAWQIRSLFLYYLFLTQSDEESIVAFLPHFADKSAVIQFLHVKQPVSRDKRGYNLHLVILRLLFQVALDKTPDVSSEGNKMMVYYQRHIKPKEQTRTGTFFKSLAKAVSNNLSHSYMTKREAKLFPRLTELWHSAGVDNCEIIPYEQLWSLLKAQHARH